MLPEEPDREQKCELTLDMSTLLLTVGPVILDPPCFLFMIGAVASVSEDTMEEEEKDDAMNDETKKMQ